MAPSPLVHVRAGGIGGKAGASVAITIYDVVEGVEGGVGDGIARAGVGFVLMVEL